MGKITVVGLGPAGLDLVPPRSLAALTSGRVYLRTAQHPAAAELLAKQANVTTFDRLYEQAADFEELYTQIVHELLGAAQYQDIVYAVPGHPLVAEETVRRLRLEAPSRGITLDILPAVSCLDTIFLALGLDPAQGVQVRDALALEKTPLDTAQPAVLLQVYSRLVAGDVKLHLMELYPPEHPVKLVRAAGLAGEEEVTEFPLYELDRQACDHLSSLYVPPAVGRSSSSRYPLDPLVNVMATLRGPEGCPWDREQTHELLRRYLIEECYEVIEAIDENDMHKLQEELGDLLLQVVFHARLAEEAGCFDINAVVAGIVEKMIRRHPHVFGRTKVESSAEVLVNWQEIKRREKKAAGEEVTVLGGVPRALPALLRAYKIQGRAARVGFDWPDVEGAWTKVAEEIEELKAAAQSGDRDAVAGEVGDLLFAVVNVARFLKVEPELALAATTRKFEERFAFIEQTAASAGRSLGQLTLEEMDELWEQAKTLEKLS